MELVIVGKKYEFNSLELQYLRKKFETISFVDSYDAIDNRKSSSVLVVDNMASVQIERRAYEVICIEDFLERYLHKIFIPPKGCVPLSLHPLSREKLLLKRIVDYIFAPLILFVAFPIVLYSVYRIKKESPEDKVIFRQRRVGKDGKIFQCFKLRSMRPPQGEQELRERVFRWGRFMRDTRVDELPQLLNVLKGEMHLVGPRAEWEDLVKEYEKIWPQCYHQRHLFAPGLTGWAQVNYHGGKTLEDTRQKLMYDLYYIKHWSLGLELKIIAKTFVMVLKDVWKKVKK